MGDPMHSRPAVAIYGGTEAAPTGTVYTTTNDGMLHALDMTSGVELWSFIPREMLVRLNSLRRNTVIANRTYGLDGDIRIFKYDVDGDGIIETGDKMYAVFGFGRGGAGYYALDVTSRAAPRFLWKKTNADLPMLGQAWSAPTITRVNVDSTLQTDPAEVRADLRRRLRHVAGRVRVHRRWRGQRRVHARARDGQPAVERRQDGLDRDLAAPVHETTRSRRTSRCST
jgi:hypothetical protein